MTINMNQNLAQTVKMDDFIIFFLNWTCFFSQKEQSFLMVETTAYFEAYRYVLEGLQEQMEDNLPFQRLVCVCVSVCLYMCVYVWCAVEEF